MKNIPLVLIHGYPFDRTMWYSTIASLGSSARVIAPDLPGFGRNSVPRKVEPSLEYYADFIAQELKDAGQAKAVVAGMSMGGYVALAFAEKYPEMLVGLGLISSQAAADTAEAKVGRAESIANVRANGPDVVADNIGQKMFSQKASPEMREYPKEGAMKAGVEGLCWALEAMAKRPDRTQVIRGLKCPVLIVHGTEDKIVPYAKARDLADECEKPIFVEATGAGHATPLEAPDKVAGGLIRLMQTSQEYSKEMASES